MTAIEKALLAKIEVLETTLRLRAEASEVPRSAHPMGTRARADADLRQRRERRRARIAVAIAHDQVMARFRAALKLRPDDQKLADWARIWVREPYPDWQPAARDMPLWRQQRDTPPVPTGPRW